MLQFDDVSLRRGPRLLFSAAVFQVHPGKKVGLTGANGCGKSSLFAMVMGGVQADQGEIRMPAGWVIAHVAQESAATDRAAIEYVLDGDTGLRELEARLQAAEVAADGEAIAHLHAELDHIGGYQARSRAAQLMSGLGFAATDAERPIRAFSGGWRMRLNLARTLMCRSDLLLLDEPTNHLDLDAVIWLEGWLRHYPGTLLLISHDRDFLDSIVDQVLHIEQGRVKLYTGNYSAFERVRAEQLANQQALFEKQQREVAHMRSYVDRFRAKATKARQAQSRLKALERMELIAPAHIDSPFHFAFLPPRKTPHPLLQLDHCGFAYADHRVLDKVRLELVPGDRVGLLGRNGAGKSTLVRILAGELEAEGLRAPARDLHIGYFAQHQLEQLQAEHTPLEHLQQLDRGASEQALRDFLGGFGFAGDKALEKVAPFSGGEKSRLVLAMLVYQRPNLLLLDEPTNHLDLEMRQALAQALQDFEGAMVIVSHDRHLLRVSCDRLLLVDGGRVGDFGDDLDAYPAWLAGAALPAGDDSGQGTTPAANNAARARRDRKRQQAEERKKLQPLKRSVERAEKRLAELQVQRGELEATLADNALYDGSRQDELSALLQAKGEIDRALEDAELDWLRAMDALETAQGEFA